MTRSVVRRRTVKITGLLLCLMMLAFWVFSVMFMSYYEPPSRQWCVSLSSGRISLEYPPRHIHYSYNPQAARTNPNPRWEFVASYSRLLVPPEEPWIEFAHNFLGFGLPGKTFVGGLQSPFWLLVVAVGFPTAMLWWCDRRPKAGLCRLCKYNLSGNESGVCP